MRWMIGVDLSGLSGGAVTYGRWMAQRASGDTFFGVHVVENVEIEPPLTRNVAEHIERALGPVREEAFFADLGTIPATAAEDGLIEAAQEKDCQGFILGRRTSDPTALVRLGRVARIMLRKLPKPIIVVPPAMETSAISDGPVLLATDLGPASDGAAKFAPVLAQSLGLDMLVTHVSRVPGSMQAIIPSEQWSNLVGRAETSSRELFDPWLEKHGLADARHSLVHGSPPAKILEVARVSGASMIVLGSRGLDGFDRIFLSSLASEIAAASNIPVAVVPNDYE